MIGETLPDYLSHGQFRLAVRDRNRRVVGFGFDNQLIAKIFPDNFTAGLSQFLDKDNILFEIKAELIYCKKVATGMYQAGIKFIGTELEVLGFVKRLVKEYNFRKSSIHGPVTINFQVSQGPPIVDGPHKAKFTLSE